MVINNRPFEGNPSNVSQNEVVCIRNIICGAEIDLDDGEYPPVFFHCTRWMGTIFPKAFLGKFWGESLKLCLTLVMSRKQPCRGPDWKARDR